MTNSTITSNLRFPGQYEDGESGYHYNFNRMYNNSVGKYLSNDPLGVEGSINRQFYVNENPVNIIDPLGLLEIWIGGAKDNVYRNVRNFFDLFNINHPESARKYSEWGNVGGLFDYINTYHQEHKCEPIILIGHSFGGTDTVKLAIKLRKRHIKVKLLITVDPVGSKTQYFPFNGPGLNLDNVEQWIDINAKPSKGDNSDAIANIGGKWDTWPYKEKKHKKLRQPDIFYEPPFHHADFGLMMKFMNGKMSAVTFLESINSKDCKCK